jgi:hypothetical protein
MKIALKELQNEKKMRNYISINSIKIQKNNIGISKASSIKMALAEWKKK